MPRPCHGALLLALISAPLSAQQSTTDSIRFDRLAALGRLWATVKYFHPALADRHLDWDSALAATIMTKCSSRRAA